MLKVINARAGAAAAAGPLFGNINGTESDDYLVGTVNDDRIRGLGGNDYMVGAEGSDTLAGGDGNDNMYGDAEYSIGLSDGHDLMYGGRGHDFMVGGGGSDTMYGGSGDDFMYGGIGFGDESADRADLLLGGLGNDFLVGGHGDDTLRGEGGDDGLRGGFGNDVLDGGGGKDRVSLNFSSAFQGVTYSAEGFQFKAEHTMDDGFGGVDTLINIEMLTFVGSRFDDKYFGSDYVDLITGNAGNDTILAGDGDDMIYGGDGNDVVSGGAGADTFYYFSVANQGRDVIRDLEAGDLVDLSAIDADLNADGDQAFNLVDEFNGEAGQAVLIYLDDRNRTILQLDQDGDGKADLVIAMIGDQTGFDGFVF